MRQQRWGGGAQIYSKTNKQTKQKTINNQKINKNKQENNGTQRTDGEEGVEFVGYKKGSHDDVILQ